MDSPNVLPDSVYDGISDLYCDWLQLEKFDRLVDTRDVDLQDSSSALLIFPPLRVLSLTDLVSDRLLGVAPSPGT